jgi:uncharacterized membrane protein SpoIIM required for sporulation
MRETSFIEQNEEKWREFEQILEGQRHDPEKLNELFIKVTDDLSYARTFYPNRSVRVYLNGLAQKVFFYIYKGKTSRRSRFITFWTYDLPLLVYEARKELLLSFVIFVFAIAIGMLSSAADPNFPRSILGDHYINMTDENIRSGDPMAIYKEKGELNMFLGITLNNILVALQTFVLGIFYAIGTIGSLLYNGIMLGAFQFFFIEKGLFWESFLAVWLHGAFEISSIVIAGAAGLTMGKGLVFPGTLSRMRSFQLAARRGMSILTGTIPLFIVAGFIESYFTRHTEAPDFLRGTFIFACFIFVVFYFVIFPWLKARKSFISSEEKRLTPDVVRRVDYSIIKTTGDLFTETFIFYRKNFQPIVSVSFVGAVLYCVGAFLWTDTKIASMFIYQQGIFGSLQALPQFLIHKHHTLLFPFATVAMSLVAYTVLRAVSKDSDEAHQNDKKTALNQLADFMKTLFIVTLFNLALFTMSWYTLILVLAVFPLLFLWAQIMLSENKGIFFGLERSLRLIGNVYGQMLGLFFTLFLCGMLFMFILDSGSILLLGKGLIWFLLEIISMNFYFSSENAAIFSTIVITFMMIFILLLIFGLWVAGSGLQYFSNLEIHGATFLKERLKQIGKRQKIRGLERED